MAEQEIDAGEGKGDSDVESETQTESHFWENHVVCVWKGWTDWGEEVEMAFLLLSTSISQWFPPTIPWDITSLPLQVIILHSLSYMWQKALSYTQRGASQDYALATEASFPLWCIRGNQYIQYKLFTHKSDFRKSGKMWGKNIQNIIV